MTMSMWRALVCLVLVSYAAMGTAAAPQVSKGKKGPDLTGQWQLVVTFNRGGGTDGTLRLTQQGTKVTGNFTRQDVDDTVTGTIKGQSLTLAFVGKHGDLTSTLTLTGTIESERTFKGTAIARTTGPGTEMGAEGTFVATRKS
jgi:hypothetical protein